MNIKLGEWSGSDATKDLHSTLKTFINASIKQTKTMIYLTWAIVFLTVLLLAGLVIQIRIQMDDRNVPSSEISIEREKHSEISAEPNKRPTIESDQQEPVMDEAEESTEENTKSAT